MGSRAKSSDLAWPGPARPYLRAGASKCGNFDNFWLMFVYLINLIDNIIIYYSFKIKIIPLDSH
jgi:hypothetical protein